MSSPKWPIETTKNRHWHIIVSILFYIATILLSYWLICKYAENLHKNYISIGIITLDSLLTGATITMIAFSNFSPSSSASSHVYKYTYWRSTDIFPKGGPQIVMSIFNLSFIRPATVIVLTIFATFTESLLLLLNEHFTTLFIDVTFMLMLLITFLLLLSTIVRYYTFNKNPLRTSTKYIFNKIKKKKISKNKYYELVNLIAYINGTKNLEFVVMLIRRLSSEINSPKIQSVISTIRTTNFADLNDPYSTIDRPKRKVSYYGKERYRLLILLYITLVNWSNENKQTNLIDYLKVAFEGEVYNKLYPNKNVIKARADNVGKAVGWLKAHNEISGKNSRTTNGKIVTIYDERNAFNFYDATGQTSIKANAIIKSMKASTVKGLKNDFVILISNDFKGSNLKLFNSVFLIDGNRAEKIK